MKKKKKPKKSAGSAVDYLKEERLKEWEKAQKKREVDNGHK